MGGMRSRERARDTIKGTKPYGWDPQLRVAQGMPTPSYRGSRSRLGSQRQSLTQTFPAGPLSKLSAQRMAEQDHGM